MKHSPFGLGTRGRMSMMGSLDSDVVPALPGAPGLTLTNPGTGGTLDYELTAAAPNGSTITRYEYQLNGSGGWTSVSLNLTGSIPGLTDDVSVTVAFRAVNGVGEGPTASDTETPTTEDVTGPTLSSPTGAEDGHDAYTGSVSSNETGTLWHIKTATATPADATTIKAGASQAMGSTGVQNVSGSADPETTYYLQFYAEDASDNGSNIVVSSAFTTDASPDVTAPTLSSATDAKNGDTASTGSVSTNEGNGTLYWVITTSATSPSAAQVKAGNDHTGSAASDSGSQAVSGTGVQNMAGSGLTPETGYYTHFMHEDAASNQSSVSSASGFTTDATPDVTAPTIDSVAFDEENDEIDLTFTEANFPVTVYWQVRAQASGAPNQSSMIANSGSLDGGNYSVASSPDSEAIDLSALADGDYTIYVMLKDPSDNYSTISDDDFTLTTPDVTAPTLSSATDAKNGENASTGSVSTNEDNGTLYWVITTSATSPSAAQVKAGNDHTGSTATDSGSASVSSTGVQGMAGSGLSASTTYYTHFMHEDAATNQSSVASASGFTTDAAADVTPPTLSSATDAENGSTASTGSVSTNEDNGTLYWVVTTSGTAPSAAQVKAGQDNSGSAATASGSQAVSATGVQNIAPTGLTASTSYTTHFMHEDAATNQSSVATASGFTTDAASSNTADVGFDNTSAWVQLAGFNVTGSELVLNGTNAATDWAYMASGYMEAVTGGGTVDINLNVASFDDSTVTPQFNVILYFYQTNDETQYVDADSTGIFTISATGLQTAVTGISVPSGANFMQCAIRAENANMTVSLSEIVIS